MSFRDWIEMIGLTIFAIVVGVVGCVVTIGLWVAMIVGLVAAVFGIPIWIWRHL